MTAGQLMEKLEALVDAEGLANVVECLADMCDEKADHVATNWQDKALAKVWSNNARRLSDVANRIEPTSK